MKNHIEAAAVLAVLLLAGCFEDQTIPLNESIKTGILIDDAIMAMADIYSA